MFCADVVMVQATSFVNSQLDHLFGAWGKTNLAEHDAVSTTNNKFNSAANFVQFDAEATQYFCSHTLAFTYETEEKMFCPDVIVLEALGFLLGETQDFPGSLCELVKPIFVVHLFVTPLSVAEGGTAPSVSLR